MLMKDIQLHFNVLIIFILFWSNVVTISQTSTKLTLPKFKSIFFEVDPLQSVSSQKYQLQVWSSLITSGFSPIKIFSYSYSKSISKKRYSIWNFQPHDFNIQIKLSNQNNATISQKTISLSKEFQTSLFVSVIDKTTINGYMLPFNMFHNKNPLIKVIQYDSPIQEKTYSFAPFMTTFWTQASANIQLLPHFPFLSQCFPEKPYMLINDIIKPKNCVYEDQNIIKCQDKIDDFQCIFEELLVENIDSQFWFNNHQQIIFYLYEYQITAEQFYNQKHKILNGNVTIMQYVSQLIPVFYQRNSNHKGYVNQFQIFIKTTIQQSQKIKILAAQITGTYNSSIVYPKSNIRTFVRYLNILQRLNDYNVPFYWYCIVALVINAFFVILVKLATSRIEGIHLKQKIQNLLAPAAKGGLLTTLTAGTFFILFNQICYQTNYSSVNPLFSQILSGDALEMNNIGRNGINMVFVGLYIFMAGLKQASKISSSEQLKIVFQDDPDFQKDKYTSSQLQQKIQFTKSSMVSHKSYLFICSLLIICFGFFHFCIEASVPSIYLTVYFILIAPIVNKMIQHYLKYLFLKEILYISAHFMSLLLGYYLLIVRSQTLLQFCYLYLSRFISVYVQIFLIDVLLSKIANVTLEKSEENRFYKLIHKIFGKTLEGIANQSQYERALYYSSLIITQLVSIFLLPLICISIYLAGRSNILRIGLHIIQSHMGLNFFMLLTLIPCQIYAIIAVIQVLNKVTEVRFDQVMKYNRFRFKRRQFRWMNDQFALNKNVDFFYREFQKFSFSSQLYFIISLLGYSLFLVYLGLLIVIQSSYQFLSDPIIILLIIIVTLSGDILSLIASFIAIKLKLYEKKQQEVMRQNLLKTQKYLKNNEISEFLQLQAVKDYFLNYNKDWIIHNLHLIFQKEDFQQNKGELVAKYKHYKSIFKKKDIEQKRMMKKLKQNSIVNKNIPKNIENKITISKKNFNILTKPIIYYWFYLAKQNLFLKSIINCVKKEKILKNCEYCNMDIELEALQKRQFQDLINQYRLINVNNIFDNKSFLEFYRIHQKYITICVQCKQKNLHLQTKITLKQKASKLVKRWHIMAKSRLLHRLINNK